MIWYKNVDQRTVSPMLRYRFRFWNILLKFFPSRKHRHISSSRQTSQMGIPSISSSAPSLPTVIITSPNVLVMKPASLYVK